jgi:uncharacterized protein (TIGR03437 family)
MRPEKHAALDDFEEETMLNVRTCSAFAMLALLSPMAALADITDLNVNLPVGQFINMDTGTVGSSGDFKWDGLLMTPQGSVAALTSAGGGDQLYQSIKQSDVQQLKTANALNPNVPFPLGALAATTVLVGIDAASHFFKAEVLNTPSNATLQLKLTVFGAASGGGGGAPTINKILNNYSLIPSGFVNSGVAPSTIAVVMGSNMSDAPPAAGLSLNTSAAPGLPTTSAGASATIAAGGKNYPMPLYYASPTQIAGVIPAAVPPGSATMTVTYKGQTSAAFSFTVVATALGLGTYNGVTIATDAVTGVLVDYTHAAKPGGTYVFWGSGGGADTADSDSVYTTTPHAVNQAGTQFYFGTKAGTVLYSGSSGFPGLMQINVTIPANSDTGCGVVVAGVVNGIPTNFGPFPIDGSGICHDSIYGVSGTDFANLSGQGTVKSGTVFVGQLNLPPPVGNSTLASASFSSQTGGSFAANGLTSLGSCSVQETASGAGTGTSTGLDAGTVSVSGPGVSATLQSLIKGTYIGQLGGSITGGATYTFTGTGGTDIGAFSAGLTFPSPLLTWTNQAALATVNRSGGIQFNWTGGAAGSYVLMLGTSTAADGTSGSFTCFAPQSALTFTVPAFIASVLPAGKGTLMIENSTLPTRFTAPKLDQGFAFGVTGTQINSTFQ